MKQGLGIFALAAVLLLTRSAAGATVSQKVSEAMSALEVGDYDTFVRHATGLLAIYPTFERRGEIGLQIVKAMMFLKRFEEARRYARRLLESDPYNPMSGEIQRELRLLAEVEKLPEDLVAGYLAADKMTVQHRLQAAIEQYQAVADDERSEGTELGRRARYEATRMDYVLLDREYPKDETIQPDDLVDLWRVYLADARDDEEEYLGLIALLHAYSRYAEGRRRGEDVIARPVFIAKAIDLAEENQERFQDPDKRLSLRYQLALLYKKRGFYFILHDVNLTIASYLKALGIIDDLVAQNPRWHLLTQALRHTVEMEVAMGRFEKLYEELPKWIEKYPKDIEIGKAVEYFARFCDSQKQYEYAFCANQLIWKDYPYTELADNALQRYLPLLAAHNRGELEIKLCPILYNAEELVPDEAAPPTPQGASAQAEVEPLKEMAREAHAKLVKRIGILVVLSAVAVVVFLITKRKG
ncbi:MAG: hypothetical protein V2A58_05335 [Planctomycetota bacterium]